MNPSQEALVLAASMRGRDERDRMALIDASLAAAWELGFATSEGLTHSLDNPYRVVGGQL